MEGRKVNFCHTFMKKIAFSWSGQRADIGDIVIYRMLPNRYTQAVGPFVFLDHLAPAIHTKSDKNDTGAHPHRGIATFSYLFSGENEHFDSLGNHQRVRNGGIQWMKAGNGIVHDEKIHPAENEKVHGVQFWINLPSAIKAETPDYRAIQPEDIPVVQLNEAKIKVLLGQYEDKRAEIPVFNGEFLLHVEIIPGKEWQITTKEGIEYGALLPTSDAIINETTFSAGDFIEFDRNGGSIQIKNNHSQSLHLLLFGGDPYTEPIVADGPFVMNSHAEIGLAYREFFAGKYGSIKAM